METSMFFRHRRYAARRDLRAQRRRKSELVTRLDEPARAARRGRLVAALIVFERAYAMRTEHLGRLLGNRVVRYIPSGRRRYRRDGCSGGGGDDTAAARDGDRTRVAAGWVDE